MTKLRIAYDIKLKRPACVLVAAGMGADAQLAHRFHVDHWLLAPTPDMRVYPITEQQLSQLVLLTDIHASNVAKKEEA
jgi:hypothetical protein